MKLLRRALYVQAALWAVGGTAVAVAPRFVLETVFDQVPSPDDAYVRMAGVLAFGLALLMVLVVQGSEDRWWWTWAFVVVDAGAGAVALANALGAAPDGSAGGLWWLLAALDLLSGLGLVFGLAKTGMEHPPV